MKWKKVKEEPSVDFYKRLEGKQIPILTLDEKWHTLFPEHLKNGKIKNLEKEVNHLLKKQGKKNSELAQLEKLKKTLMDKIISNMGQAQHDDFVAKKQEKSQSLILEINHKIEKVEEELELLPEELRTVNEMLLIESMNICYERLEDNKKEIQQLDIWIGQIREQLKEKILLKQDKEIQNTNIYSYMHHMLGRELIEIFDITEEVAAEQEEEKEEE